MAEPANLVFIGWSKERSKAMGTVLHKWLMHFVPACQPWYSPADIEAGTVWDEELQRALNRSVYGILCVTSDNYASPWLNYECGELSNRLERRVCPLLLDASPNDLSPTPLSRRQAKAAFSRDEMFQLVTAINGSLDRPTPDQVVKHSFDLNWESFESDLKVIPAAAAVPVKPRGMEEKLDELLALMRNARTVGERATSATGGVPANVWKYLKENGDKFRTEDLRNIYRTLEVVQRAQADSVGGGVVHFPSGAGTDDVGLGDDKGK